jgi:phage repressor protein C with HTH and peptisase S24 domain
MGRITQIAERLRQGETVQWRPHGNSMTPRIKSGQLVIIEPATLADVKKGDIVLAKVRGNYYLHLVRQIGSDGQVLISNNHGHDNGWSRKVFGKVVKVEP